MQKLVIFASGAGSNALNIIRYFSKHPHIRVSAIVCNHPAAGVLSHGHAHHIPSLLITRRLLNDRDWFLRQIDALGADFLVLAGFLLLVPEYLIDAFPDKIINIHPALLPKYGGKGMYGMRVHEAVKQAGDKETGITIHLVNKHYDEGEIVLQKHIAVDNSDTPEQIAQKVHALEYAWYPQAIEKWVLSTEAN